MSSFNWKRQQRQGRIHLCFTISSILRSGISVCHSVVAAAEEMAAVDDRDGTDRPADVADLKDLTRALSKLNPSAEEFVPSSRRPAATRLSAEAPAFVASMRLFGMMIDGDDGSSCNHQPRWRKYNYDQRPRKVNDRVHGAQKEDCIRRTVYVSDIDHHVSEEQLAALFGNCGKVLDCRICGDLNSFLRFAFIEYANEHGARQALDLDGTVLGYYPVKVMPSKTAILPVNPTFLPRSEDEREMCARTIYCTDIDKQIRQTDLKGFFELFCGEVSRLRILGDHLHSTRIAFVEFVEVESALAALNCSGVVLGACPIRVSPSKTPVRSSLPTDKTIMR
ncbi:polyadenylate-binding protein-interacting protein 8-like [Musa acuminata AAA Group]|uniref:polyadenylate-binding protein-interacting protein 8 n=1 Tax=Musa acuminata AAA Group TaxID=214697 RepID=UPI0031E1EF5B